MTHEESYSITIRFPTAHPLTDNEITIYKHWLSNNVASHVTSVEYPKGPNSRHIQSVVTFEQDLPKNYAHNKKIQLINLYPRAENCLNQHGKNIAIIVKYIKNSKDLEYMRGYPLKDLDLDDPDEEMWSTFDTDSLKSYHRAWYSHLPGRKRKRVYEVILDRKTWPQQIMEYRLQNTDAFEHIMDRPRTDYVKPILRAMLADPRVSFQFLSPGRRYMILNERLKPQPDYDKVVDLLYEANFVGPFAQKYMTPFRF